MKNKSAIIIISTFLFVALGLTALVASKKHIGGNVLSLPIEYDIENNLLPSPWSNNNVLSTLLFRTLFKPDHTLMNISPDLASGYTIENAGYTYHITLKDDNRWSDGTLISPEDVVFSIEAFLEQKDVNINPLLSRAFREIRKIEIVGNTIILDLWDRHFNFLPALAQFAIMPKHMLEGTDISEFSKHQYLANPLSSSKYKIAEFVPNSHFVLHRNEYYTEKKPKIEEIRLYFSYNINELDYFSTFDVTDMTFFKTRRGFTEYRATMEYDRYLVFNIEGDDGFINERMLDRRVREAICYAIDNTNLVNTIYFQLGSEFHDAVSHIDGYYDYNPEKARELLLASGFNTDKPLRLTSYAEDATTLDALKIMADDLRKVGFLVEVKIGQSFDQLYNIRDYDVLFKGLAAFNYLEWYQEYDSAHPFLTKIIDTGPNFNALLVQANTITDEDEHDTIIENLHQLDRSFLYKFPIYSPIRSVYINTARVKLPKDIVFGNPWYIHDLNFSEWEIIKD